MYRFIDTVSIDATSITGYYLGRKRREQDEEEERGAASAVEEVSRGDWH
jgi:hypothetical protein